MLPFSSNLSVPYSSLQILFLVYMDLGKKMASYKSYVWFQNIDIDIDIDIDIFQKCRYIDNRYVISIYRTGLQPPLALVWQLQTYCPPLHPQCKMPRGRQFPPSPPHSSWKMMPLLLRRSCQHQWTGGLSGKKWDDQRDAATSESRKSRVKAIIRIQTPT